MLHSAQQITKKILQWCTYLKKLIYHDGLFLIGVTFFVVDII